MGYQYIPGQPNYNAAVSAPREALTIGLDYYTITTNINILPSAPYQLWTDPTGFVAVEPSPADFANLSNAANTVDYVPGYIPNDFSQDALDKLVEIISQRGQPVIMGTPSGSGPYTFKFAIEHNSAWGITANSSAQFVPLLANAICLAGIDFGWGYNVSNTYDTSLMNSVDSALNVTILNSF